MRVCASGGAGGNRTRYLFNAIEALSQMSYSPTSCVDGKKPPARRDCIKSDSISQRLLRHNSETATTVIPMPLQPSSRHLRNRHSGAPTTVIPAFPQPSFRRIYNRHSGASTTVIPAHLQPSFRRPYNRHPGNSTTVIPAQAGIYGRRPHCRSMGITTLDSGESRNDGGYGNGGA